MRRVAILLIVVGLLAAACGAVAELAPQSQGGVVAKPAATTTTSLPPSTTSTLPAGPLSIDQQIEVTIEDLERYWADELPETYGLAYTPPAEVGGYNVGLGDAPACGDEPLEPSLAVGNAFYCPPDDTIFWDEQELIPTLYDRFGPFAVSLVLAHEWGHAIQNRAGVPDELPTVIRELQADCFAGAWTGRALAGASPIRVGEEQLDVATSGFLLFRDPTGQTDDLSPGAHGNAFDRVGAFLDGVRRGSAECATYPEDPPEVTLGFFRSEQEFATGGNLPLEDVFPLLSGTLETYWSQTAADLGVTWDSFDELVSYEAGEAPECLGGFADPAGVASGMAYCPSSDVLALDVEGTFVPLYENFGDFGPGFVLGLAWAQKAQLELGIDVGTDAARLRSDCLAGTWAQAARQDEDGTGGISPGLDEAGDPLPPISLSPGDLDEAIQAILFLGDRQMGELDAFERVEAFRLGFFGTPEDCLGG
ncbi:MAG: neutral zinc metallopeptidase [Acidimicrobiia bacterium]